MKDSMNLQNGFVELAQDLNNKYLTFRKISGIINIQRGKEVILVKDYLDDFVCGPAIEELEEEFEAWQLLMQEENVRYLTLSENCDIIYM